MAVQIPTDKRFRRAHVKPSRRRRLTAARRRVVRAAVLLVAFATGGYWLTDMVRHAPVLAIDTIVVEGNDRLSTGEVLALSGDLHDQNILLADLKIQRARLLTSGWVEDATLRRVLPATIEVVIRERPPVALSRFSGRLYLIDAVGTVIDEYGPRFSDFDLPIVDGLSIGDEREIVVDNARVLLATRVIGAVAGQGVLAGRISQIDVHDPRDAVVLLSGDPALIHLGSERFVERLLEYIELAPMLRARVSEIDSVDLRFDHRVYVRPAGPTGPPARQERLTPRGQ